jgi:hypothetical protein
MDTNVTHLKEEKHYTTGSTLTPWMDPGDHWTVPYIDNKCSTSTHTSTGRRAPIVIDSEKRINSIPRSP